MKSAVMAAFLTAILLSGCAGTSTLELQVAQLPESTLKCLPAPLKGKKFIKLNQKQAAYLLASYKTAHADCESKLTTVRRIYHKWKNAAKKSKT